MLISVFHMSGLYPGRVHVDVVSVVVCGFTVVVDRRVVGVVDLAGCDALLQRSSSGD